MKLPEKLNAIEYSSTTLIAKKLNDIIDYMLYNNTINGNIADMHVSPNFNYLTKVDLQQRAELLKNATYTSDKGWHITIPKPEWWEDTNYTFLTQRRRDYRAALKDASKASGILFKLED